MGDIAGQRRGLSKRGAMLAVIATLMAIAGGIGWYAMQGPNVPITELELAGTAERAQQGMGDSKADFITAVHADWVLIFGYLVALVVATWLGRRVFWTPKARWVATVALIASAVAVGADVIENVLLYVALDSPTGGVWAFPQGWLSSSSACSLSRFRSPSSAGQLPLVGLGPIGENAGTWPKRTWLKKMCCRLLPSSLQGTDRSPRILRETRIQ
jgi:hypothetical protein